MKVRVWFFIPLMFLIAAAGAYWFRGSLNAARRPARETRALAVGYELRNSTNSPMLIGASEEFKSDLASLLDGPAWSLIDRSPPRDPWAVVRLIITNEQGRALHLSLKDEFPSERLRLLSYRLVTGPGAPGSSLATGRATNPISSSNVSDR